MSRCPDCYSRGECQDWCGREPVDMQDEIDEIQSENYKLKEENKKLRECVELIAIDDPEAIGNKPDYKIAQECLKELDA